MLEIIKFLFKFGGLFFFPSLKTIHAYIYIDAILESATWS